MAELVDPRSSQVVLIGTAQYRHLPPLPSTRQNLIGLRDVFTDEALWGLPLESCHVMEDASDPSTVGRAVRAAAAAAVGDGLLLVYYAGHGLIDPHDGALVLALVDSEKDVPHEAGLLYDWIRRAVAASPARRRIVILDCCYAGRASSELSGNNTGTDAVADQAEIDKTCLLVSASRNRTAQAPPGERYTAFTGQLLRVLREGLADGPPVLGIEAIWREVRTSLLANGHERPELRARNGGGDIPLVRNAAKPRQQLAGRVLMAAPHVRDADLRQAVVLILRHDRQRGAVGVRVNMPSAEQPGVVPSDWYPLLNDPAVLFDGGPVGRDGFIALARLRPDATPPVRFPVVRGRLGTVAMSMNPALLRPVLASARLFRGYLGWGPGQLENELDSGVLVHPASSSFSAPFSARPDDLWASLQPRT